MLLFHCTNIFWKQIFRWSGKKYSRLGPNLCFLIYISYSQCSVDTKTTFRVIREWLWKVLRTPLYSAALRTANGKIVSNVMVFGNVWIAFGELLYGSISVEHQKCPSFLFIGSISLFTSLSSSFVFPNFCSKRVSKFYGSLWSRLSTFLTSFILFSKAIPAWNGCKIYTTCSTICKDETDQDHTACKPKMLSWLFYVTHPFNHL